RFSPSFKPGSMKLRRYKSSVLPNALQMEKQAAGTAAFNPAATYNKVIVFFNFGVDGATAGAQTFFFDDIDVGAGSGGGGGGGSGAVDFESGSATFSDFEGGATALIANPDPSGLNTSTMVAQMQKFAGQPFGGSTLDLGGSVALAAGDSYLMLVRSLRPVEVTFKLEPMGDERTANHSGSGTWEQLCFDFSGVAGDITGITIIFDNGTVGDAANDPDNWTFQFDDIQQTSDSCPVAGPTFETITFDDPAITYTLIGFGGAEGSFVTNDPAGGTNMVVQVDRAAGAEIFAGTTVATDASNNSIPPIPLDAMNTQMTVRTYSPAAGITVRLKIEDASDPTVSVETEAMTTVANDWETLTFNFLNEVSGTAAFNPAATYDKATIFFNFGAAGAPAETYFFDDLDVLSGTGAGGGGAFDPITFDDPAITYTLIGFGGAEDSTVVGDPTGGSNMVAQVNRAAGAEIFAGTTVATDASNNSIPTIPLDAMNTQMTVRVYSPAAGVPVRLKVEDASDPTVSVETEAMTTMTNAWETLTFNFLNEVSGTAAFNPAATYDKATIFFNFGAAGAPAETYFFDDLGGLAGTGAGGGGGAFDPITFDDPAITYTLIGFGGAEDSTVVGDPTGGSNMVAQVNRAAGAETFAGTTVATDASNNSIPTIPLDAMNTQMTVRVYSPAAGVPVRLKVEDASDPTVSVETEAMTTVANTWETLTFDFANEAMGTAAFNPAATYDKATIFFNFGAAGAPAETYFFDDISVL
ncbi:MAG: hypothetical protein AAF438_16010, partial [Pseudomonadota bacterium]